ncbi:MAG: hypothetical protein QW327_04810 [Candidatus Odinarchaeota archaeon]
MSCPICDKGEGEFCENHASAYISVVEAFKKWQTATPIRWEDYLKRIIDNEYTGKWAREVAEYLLRKGSPPSGVT